MRYMVGSAGQGATFEAIRAAIPDFGLLLTPGSWRLPHVPYALDNGVYAAFRKSLDYHRSEAEQCYYRSFWWSCEGDEDWRKMLSKVPADNPPLWVLLPDRVADWNATVELASLYLPIVRSMGLPVAIALQEGCDFDQVLDFAPDWVFVGGLDDWKEQTIAPACRYFQPKGIRVHVGRVTTQRRIWMCMAAGADSCDGTGINKYPTKEIRVVSTALYQGCLQI